LILLDPSAIIATEALRRDGRGRGHPARLNFGACMAHALAAPLLFQGDDFARNDTVSALA
jgi:ribonuclease VapC